jgi:hypothetical protein
VIEGITGKHGTATIKVRGNSERARDGSETGYVRWDGGNTRVKLTIEATNLPVDKDLFDAVEGSEFAGFLDTYRLSGIVDRVLLDIVQEEPRDDASVVEVEIHLGGDTFVYAPFPLTLTDVTGKVVLLRPPVGDLERGKEFHVDAVGRAAGTTVAVKADLLESQRTGRVVVSAEDAVLEGEITRAVLSSAAGEGGLGEVWRFLRPFGRADATAEFPVYDDPAPESFRVVLKDAGVHVGAEGPAGGVRIEGLRGGVHVVGSRVTVSEVAGTFEGAPVRVSGTLDGGPAGDWDLLVASERVPLTEGLLAVVRNASPDGDLFPADVSVEPGGRLDLQVRLLRTQQGSEAQRSLAANVAVRNADLTVRLGSLRVALTGDFDVEGDEVHLRNVTAEGSGVSLEIPDAVLGPNGLRGSLSARFDDLELSPEVLDLLPDGVRGTLEDLTKDRRLDALGLAVTADPSGRLTLEGALGFKARDGAPPGGAPRGRFTFAPLVLGAADERGDRALSGLVKLDGVSIDVGVPIDDLFGEVTLDRLALGGTPRGDGTLRARSVRIAGVRVTDLEGPVSWGESILRAGPLVGAVHGGRLDALVTAHTKPPTAYEARLGIRDVALAGLLEDLGADTDVVGTLAADFELQNRGGTRRDLTGVGSARVTEGDLGELPVVATLPALHAAVWGGSRPAFRTASAAFTIERERFRIAPLTLAGSMFRMCGFGTLTFDGEIDVTFAPQFVKSLFLPGWQSAPLAPSLLAPLREDPLYVARVQGTLADAQPKLLPLPFLTRRAWAQPPVYRASPLETKPERRVPALFR